VNFGVGESNILLPAQGQFNVRVKSGIGKAVIEIPAGMAARVRATAGIGNIDVNGDFQRDGSYYLSRDFDSAQNRVEIDVNGGIGELRIIKR
jgi:predicted membrane protein